VSYRRTYFFYLNSNYSEKRRPEGFATSISLYFFARNFNLNIFKNDSSISNTNKNYSVLKIDRTIVKEPETAPLPISHLIFTWRS
jgi:hypothetical protein